MTLQGFSRTRLKAALDRLYSSFNSADSASDPVHIVRRYSDPADREVVAFFAAALAFGRVASVLSSVESLLAPMGNSPSSFVRSFKPQRDGILLRRLRHRWVHGLDLIALVWILSQMLETAGSVEEFFMKGYKSGSTDLSEALESFSGRARSMDLASIYGEPLDVPGVGYFFPRPSSGSGCKRLNLFLRWMVRRDAVDMGVWSRVRTSQLVIPLDTHLVRVSRCLGLTRYRSPGWRMAVEITSSLKELNPIDPIKYDFSLCHLGMTNLCSFTQPRRKGHCPLEDICQPSLS